MRLSRVRKAVRYHANPMPKKMYVRVDNHYTLPIGGIRVEEIGIRPLFREIETLCERNLGVLPSKSQILVVALIAYRDYLKKLFKVKR